jgi:hypothetical protein
MTASKIPGRFQPSSSMESTNTLYQSYKSSSASSAFLCPSSFLIFLLFKQLLVKGTKPKFSQARPQNLFLGRLDICTPRASLQTVVRSCLNVLTNPNKIGSLCRKEPHPPGAQSHCNNDTLLLVRAQRCTPQSPRDSRQPSLQRGIR